MQIVTGANATGQSRGKESSRPRGRLRRALGAACLAGSLITLITPFSQGATAQVANLTFLELDQNIRSNGGLDWGHSGGFTGTGGVFNGGVFNGVNTPPTPPQQVATDPSILDTAFIVDPLSSDVTACGTGDPTVFTATGGEKNGDFLPGMTYSTGSVPPKDEISNVYGLSRLEAGGSGEVYFGAERVETSGDSHIDFEFLQSTVTKTGTCAGSFTGDRTQGDLLLAVDFTQGGTLGTVQLYEWQCDVPVQPAKDGTVCNNTTGGPKGPTNPAPHYFPIPTPNAVTIDVNAAGPVACGGWVCRDSSGNQIASVPTNGFVEGGIDLTAAGFQGCLNSFLPHTRSSQEITATLKDFGGPAELITCAPAQITTTSDPNLTQAGGGVVTAGDSVTDQISVTGPAGPGQGTVDFFLCGPTPSAANCTTGGIQLGDNVALVNGTATSSAFNVIATTVPGVYCWRGEYTPAAGFRYEPGSHTNTTTECFRVKQASRTETTSNPNITQPGGGEVFAGAGVTDSVTVAGDFGTPTGTVSFVVCGPDPAATACTTGGTAVGGPVTLTNGTATSSAFTVDVNTAVGVYCWRAEYSGNTVYLSSSHTNTTTECFEVVPPPPITVRLVKTNDANGDATYTDDERAPAAGRDVPFEVVITNTSTVPVVITTLTDEAAGLPVHAITCNPALANAPLAAGASVTCLFTEPGYSPAAGTERINTARVTVAQVGVPTNTASANDTSRVTSPPTITVTIDKTNNANGDATFSDSERAPAAGRDVPFRAVVTNTSAVPVTITALTDEFPTSAAATVCQNLINTTLAAGASATCNFTLTGYSPPAGDSKVNVARVTVTEVGQPGNSASDNDDSTVISPPAITVAIEKTNNANGDATFSDDERAPAAGRDVPFRAVVTNTSAVPVTITALTDEFPTSAAATVCANLINTTLAAGASATCNFTLTGYSPPAGDSKINTAKVTVTEVGQPGNSASAQDNSTVRTPPAITVTIVKDNDANGDGQFSDSEAAAVAGQGVPFRAVVRNTSAVPVTITALTDEFPGSPAATACPNLIGKLRPARGHRQDQHREGDGHRGRSAGQLGVSPGHLSGGHRPGPFPFVRGRYYQDRRPGHGPAG
jgi:hypothetical protein